MEDLLDMITEWVNRNPNDTSNAGNILVLAELVIDAHLAEESTDSVWDARDDYLREQRAAIISAERRR